MQSMAASSRHQNMCGSRWVTTSDLPSSSSAQRPLLTTHIFPPAAGASGRAFWLLYITLAWQLGCLLSRAGGNISLPQGALNDAPCQKVTLRYCLPRSEAHADSPAPGGSFILCPRLFHLSRAIGMLQMHPGLCSCKLATIYIV